MAKIIIEIDVDDEMSDPADSTGLTNEAFEEVFDAVQGLGSDISIRPAGLARVSIQPGRPVIGS